MPLLDTNYDGDSQLFSETELNLSGGTSNVITGGNYTFSLSAGVLTSGASKTGIDNYKLDISGSMLSGGDYIFREPKGVITSGSTKTENPIFGAEGFVGDGGDDFAGAGYIIVDGDVVAESTVIFPQYSFGTVIEEAIVGGSRFGTPEIRLLILGGESGELGDEFSKYGRYESNAFFGNITVKVKDATGNPAADSNVSIGGISGTTNSEGSVTFSTAGTKTAEAIRGSVSEEVEIPPSSDKTVDFQYAGVRGSINNPSGESITGANVTLIDKQGIIISNDTTDNSGNFEFVEAPINKDMYIITGNYFQEITTSSQGSFTSANFPAPVFYKGSPLSHAEDGDAYELITKDQLGSFNIRATDEITGAPVHNVLVEVNGYESKTDDFGEASAFYDLTSSSDVYISIGENRRYRIANIVAEQDEVTDGINIELQRYVQSSKK